jgi:cobyrinic acid a,c-diamide synthase
MDGQLSVAIAYDEAFNCYFPDAFDLLELHGASLVDFSPLRDEGLPAEAELVCLGCGHPERHAATLSENHCMKAALRSHLTRGARIYGEGGGAAYLCQHMETPTGELKRMVGVLPAAARLKPTPVPPSPVQVTLSRPNWLGKSGTRLRGYRNPNWDIQPLGEAASYVAEQQHRGELLGSFQAIGSLLHLHFAGMLTLLRRFLRPEVPEPDFRDPWAAVS